MVRMAVLMVLKMRWYPASEVERRTALQSPRLRTAVRLADGPALASPHPRRPLLPDSGDKAFPAAVNGPADQSFGGGLKRLPLVRGQ